MHRRLLEATGGSFAFAALTAVLAAGGSVSVCEAVTATLSVAAALVPSGFLPGGGWRRRAVELGTLVVALSLVLLKDPTARQTAVPPLLVGLALIAALEATRRAYDGKAPVLAAALAVAITSSVGGGLLGYTAPLVALAAAVPALASAVVAHRLSALAGFAAALVTAPLPLAHHPELLAIPVLFASAGLLSQRLRQALATGCRRALPLAVACGVLLAVVAVGGGMSPGRLFPDARWLAFVVVIAMIVGVPRLPTGVGGAFWFLAAFLLGPTHRPPHDPAVELTEVNAQAILPSAWGGRYVLDASLANAGGVPLGAAVAEVRAGSLRYTLRAGIEAVEWAHERFDVRPLVAHPLPRHPVWRPAGVGKDAFWAVAGRTTAVALPPATVIIERAAALPTGVIVSVSAGPSRAAPPREWLAPVWLLATAGVVFLLQLVSGVWRRACAVVPWTLLFVAVVTVRVPVAPLADLVERHGIDVALAVLVTAWLAAARAWLASGRVFLTSCALLVPLSLATAHLTPPMYGDEPYHLAVLAALADGAGLSEAVAAGAPPGVPPLHGPFLSVVLLPGYLLAKRSGALLMLAVAAAVTLALVVRRASSLGLSSSRVAMAASTALLTAPLATYASQIWPEVIGALAVAAGLALVAAPRPPRVAVALVAVAATAIKTRLALLTFPLAAVAWLPKRLSWRSVATAALGLGAAAAVALSAGWLLLGHPLGAPRTLWTLVPKDLRQPVLTLGGLLFDPAGGVAFAAPLLLVTLAGLALLWRRGGTGERAALLGLAATVGALLHSVEWYGGGSPPVRYLVPALPVFWLSGMLLLGRPRRWLVPCTLAVPLAGLSWWALVTRPQFSINPGTGRYWLTDLLAGRFGCDVRHLVPSFLRPTTATVVVPLALISGAAAVVLLAHATRAGARTLVRHSAACWLIGGTVLAAHLQWRSDRVVEVEDAQVARLGGRPEPAEGTWSSYRYAGGWKVGEGEGVVVPLRLPGGARVTVGGWLEGEAQRGCSLEVSWDGAAAQSLPLRGAAAGKVSLPAVPERGRHDLRLLVRAPRGGEVVLDRIIVER